MDRSYLLALCIVLYAVTTTLSQNDTNTTSTTPAPTIISTVVYTTDSPTGQPTAEPTTATPSVSPTTSQPSTSPTNQPSATPTSSPSVSPTTSEPTTSPSGQPTQAPTDEPTLEPTFEPTVEPTAEPTTEQPTEEPTMYPIDFMSSTEIEPTPNPTVAACDLVSWLLETVLSNVPFFANPDTESVRYAFIEALATTIAELLGDAANDLCFDLPADQFSISPTSTGRRRRQLLQTTTNYDISAGFEYGDALQSAVFGNSAVYNPTSFASDFGANLVAVMIEAALVESTLSASDLNLAVIDPVAVTATTTAEATTEEPSEPVCIDATVEIVVQDCTYSYLEAEIRDIALTGIADCAGDDDEFSAQPATAATTSTDDDDASTEYKYEQEVCVKDQAAAQALEACVESSDFGAALEEDIDLATNCSSVASGSAEIQDGDDDDEGGVVLWMPWTYGSNYLAWIVFGAVVCALCVICFCLCRCVKQCCDGSDRFKRAKSGYTIGGPLFGQVKSNDEAENAFTSDLKSAIEMNKQGKLLQHHSGSLDLDAGAVADAFDMNFDEKKPIKHDTDDHAAAAAAADKEEKKEEPKAKDKDKDKGKGKEKKEEKKDKKAAKKNSEGAAKPLVGNTDYDETPGGPDDDEHAPPPPEPPVQEQDDYDLL